ncbi:MAG TPA: hypothetical protein PK771_10680, partial [Spirochaetota bacterium]|nr:hypothetical protein [Spirochaetota bacterium]
HRPFNPKSNEYFNILKKLFIDIKKIDSIEKSLMLEKLQFIIFFRIIKYFSNEKELNFITENCIDSNLLDLFQIVIKTENSEKFDICHLNYQNNLINNLEKTKKKILIKYYILNKDFDKIKSILDDFLHF